MIKLIGIDIDGTVLPHPGKIHDRTREALHKAIENGYHVSIVTGRNTTTVYPIIKQLGLQDHEFYIGAQNGGQVCKYSPEKKFEVEYKTSFSKPEAKEILDILKRNKIDFFCYTENDKIAYSSKQLSLYVLWMRKRTRSKIITYKKDKKLIVNITKFICFGHKQNIQAVRDIFDKKGYSTFAFSYVSDSKQNIEVSPKGVNKAKALEYISNKLSINPEEVIFFGDGENDIEALKWSGVGVAMLNGSDKVKTHANEITNLNVNDGGVGEFLEVKIFIKK